MNDLTRQPRETFTKSSGTVGPEQRTILKGDLSFIKRQHQRAPAKAKIDDSLEGISKFSCVNLYISIYALVFPPG